MKEVVADFGENLSRVIERMMKLSEKSKENCYCEFNGVMIQCNRFMSTVEVREEFDRMKNVMQQAYQKSGEYLESQKKQEDYEAEKKLDMYNILKQAKNNMSNLENMDNLLVWLKKYISASDYIYVESEGDFVLKMLKDFGYITNEYIGDDFVQGDKIILGKYIIGQCMSGIESIGVIHPMVGRFIDDYFEMKSM